MLDLLHYATMHNYTIAQATIGISKYLCKFVYKFGDHLPRSKSVRNIFHTSIMYQEAISMKIASFWRKKFGDKRVDH